MKIKDLKPLEKNPFRGKGDEQLQRIGKSIQEFEKMMSIRKIVIDETNTVLGGNKRYFALKMLGYKDIPDEWIDRRADLTEQEKQRFIVTDNAHFGSDWDYDMLNEIAENWGADVADWGVEQVNFAEQGDIVELDKITTTYNINIKCETPEECEEIKQKLGITANSISASMMIGLLA